MPALANDKNVKCNLDAIFIYLRARSNNALDRGRPAKHVEKPAGFDKQQDACFGG
jgi:hypothetical protein